MSEHGMHDVVKLKGNLQHQSMQLFVEALVRKDKRLYWELCDLPPSQFWAKWKEVYPEDFPYDGMSAVSPLSVVQLPT
jgi:hypothetical protein